ncbi:TonB-dependent receptor [Filimonas lacunae]|uniref:TonB-dependent receptor n=1 Tax=Filimonas lacunae TaxID=477680 RepID=A0A173MEJ6_9BACT|nr:TonB-dependent receptor [Filimonas lacunae]BAV06022.1 TonB-dependent receptor [Filimonas lacunae]SIT24248.1 TonB-dependent receptor [Filimonas lacunae]
MKKKCERWQRLVLLWLVVLPWAGLNAQTEQISDPVTVQAEKISLPDLMASLQRQTAYIFSFDHDLLAKTEVTHIRWNKMPLGKALSELKQKAGLQYTILDRNIAVVPAVRSSKKAENIESVQTGGRITGKIVDFENSNPLAGASIRVEGTAWASTTDEQGKFELNNLPPGLYTLVLSYVGYANNRLAEVEVVAGRNTQIDGKLQPARAWNEVVVRSAGIRKRAVANTSDEQLIKEMYNAKTVISGISNEQIARTLDRDAAEVVKRIPGVNISEDRFVIVRGLGKRYNLTFLNDALAPATDADSRSFSYDVINSNAIDRIMVYKSPSPDLPGEFSGGLVKIYTKKSQLTRQVDIQLSAQYRPGSTFKDVWSYAGSKTDFLGFDNGVRNLPKGIPSATEFNHLNTQQNAVYSRQFANNYVLDKQFRSGPDLRFNINYYDAWKTGGHYISNLTSVAYTNTHEQRSTEASSYTKYIDGRIQQGIHSARLSVVQTNGLTVNKNLSFELRNFINQNGQRIAVEDYRILDDYERYENRHVNLYYVSNFIYSGQLSGKYQFGANKENGVTGNFSYSSIHKSEPDNRDYTFTRPIQPSGRGDAEDAWALSTGLISRYLLSRVFNDVKENAYQGNIDLNYHINPSLAFKAGYFYENRWRDYNNRTFVLNNGPNLYDPNLYIGPGEDPELGSGGKIPGEKLPIRVLEKYLPVYFPAAMFREDGTGYTFFEKTSPNNQYFADNTLHAGYLSGDVTLLHERLNIFGGVRVEHNRFRILGAYKAGLTAYPLQVNQPVTSVLPSVNLSFKADSNVIIRMGYGRTLNRPEFREAAPVQYSNYLEQETYLGNPALTTVNIDNAELRAEWYPKSTRRNEMVNVGVFYKRLDKPIERLRVVFSDGFDQYFYANTGQATIYGAEAELRKSFDFLGSKLFRDLSVILNGSWFKSTVKVPAQPERIGYAGARERPMQGQSPYLFNASLNYENVGYGTKLALTFNRAGDYIYVVGANPDAGRGDPDVMMKGRSQLDITWRQRINKIFSINAGVQNVLNAPVILYQDWKRNYHYDALAGKPPVFNSTLFDKGDIIYRRYYLKPYYSFSVNMIF